MKRNIDDFDGMKDFIISIVGVVAWFLIGTIVIAGYFIVETKGESIILTLVSTIFTMVSSLSIIVTIYVYNSQKNREDKKQKVIDNIIISNLNKSLSILKKVIYGVNEFYKNEYSEHYKEIKLLRSEPYLLAAFNDKKAPVYYKIIEFKNASVALQEAMNMKYKASEYLIFILDQADYIIEDFNNIFNHSLIDILKNEKLDNNIKIGALNRFVDVDSVLFLNQISDIERDLN